MLLEGSASSCVQQEADQSAGHREGPQHHLQHHTLWDNARRPKPGIIINSLRYIIFKTYFPHILGIWFENPPMSFLI